MNFGTLLLILPVGYGFSFLVMDVARMFGRRWWPASDGTRGGDVRPFAVFLALFAGPALFVDASLKLRGRGELSAVDGFLAGLIACFWAGCYGVVLLECAGRIGLMAA